MRPQRTATLPRRGQRTDSVSIFAAVAGYLLMANTPYAGIVGFDEDRVIPSNCVGFDGD